MKRFFAVSLLWTVEHFARFPRFVLMLIDAAIQPAVNWAIEHSQYFCPRCKAFTEFDKCPGCKKTTRRPGQFVLPKEASEDPGEGRR